MYCLLSRARAHGDGADHRHSFSPRRAGLLVSVPAMAPDDAAIHSVRYHSAHETAYLLECAAIGMAAEVLDARCLHDARSAHALLAVALTEGRPNRELARQFHRVLVDACPNQHMLRLVGAATRGGTVCRRADVPGSPAQIQQAHMEHQQILQLFERHAPGDEIERALRSHLADNLVCRA